MTIPDRIIKHEKTLQAQALRAQAHELLEQAQALDGKYPQVVALGGSLLDAPCAKIVWYAGELNEAQACEATDTDEDAFDAGDVEISIRAVPLRELVSCAAPANAPRRHPRGRPA